MERMTFDQLVTHWEQHGLQVNMAYQDLSKDLSLLGLDPSHPVLVWFRSYEFKDLGPYHLHHDCGKPFIAQWDGARYHYPDHGQKSFETYCSRFGEDRFAHLIRNDMAFHTARAENIAQVWSLPDSDDLYATAWAELLANVPIFGGLESDSFKIKRKRLIWALKKRPALRTTPHSN